MRVRNPLGGGNVSSRYGELLADKNGVVEVPDDLGRDLIASHGYVLHEGTVEAKGSGQARGPVSDTAPPAKGDWKRDDMIGFLKARGIAVPPSGMTNAKLAELVAANVFTPVVLVAPPAAPAAAAGTGTGQAGKDAAAEADAAKD